MNTDFILEGKKDKKILYIENVASIDSTNFYQAAALAAYECNLEFHIAYNAMDRTEKKVNEIYKKYGAIFHQIDFYRNPYDLRNIKAYQQCVNLIKQENIDIIHCNTPIGGVIGRLAGKKCKVPTIIYQAHGFHFFKGAPKLNWMLYYPIEKWLAHKTDVLITITKEDYNLAKKFRLRGDGKVYYVPGVGIDTDKYITGQQLRQKKEAKWD